MSSRRTIILMGILLALLIGYVSRPLWSPPVTSIPSIPQGEAPPLAGKNSVSGLIVRQDATGAWIADFDYFYTGGPRYATLHIKLTPRWAASGSPSAKDLKDTRLLSPKRGAHHVSAEIRYPGIPGSTVSPGSTVLVAANI